MQIEAGEFIMWTEPTPNNEAGWDRVVIQHVPTKYRKMDSAYRCKTEAEYRDILVQVLERVTAVAPRENLDSWPKDVQKQFPAMMDREQTVYDAAILALHELVG